MTILQVYEQPTQRLGRVMLGLQGVEPFLGELIGYTCENRGHGRDCEAFRHDTRSLARVLLAVLRDHPGAPHGCLPASCPRPLITQGLAHLAQDPEAFGVTLLEYTAAHAGHSDHCRAYQQNTGPLAGVLQYVHQHPDAPHGCRPDLCPRPVITSEITQRWRPL